MKTKELILAVEIQTDIINFTGSLITDLEVFHRTDYSVLEAEILEGNKFFEKLSYLLEREIILSYSYLFSESENDFYRLPKTFCLIIQKHKTLPWNTPVPIEIIIKHSESVNVIIESGKIKTIRDKVIAHKERNWRQRIASIDIKYLKELNSICEKVNDDVFRNLSINVSDSSLDKYRLMSLDSIVKHLVDYNELKEKYYSGGNYGR